MSSHMYLGSSEFIITAFNTETSLTTNLVHVLQWEAKGLVSGAGWGQDCVQGF